MTPLIRHITKAECPDWSLMAVFSDVHIGIEDKPALKIAVELCEYEGVTHNIANGDIYDCGCASAHDDKQRRAALEHGTLLKEAETGKWFLNWLRTRWCVLGEGNHEDWINDLALNSALHGSLTVRSALNLPADLEILPQGYQIRLGSLAIEHGDEIFKRGGGPKNPAQRIIDLFPDQSTLIGHVHRMSYAIRTTPDEYGIPKSRAAHSSGHMSIAHKHREYMGRAPNWQQSITLIRVWWDGNRPRYTIIPVEIHRDRYNKPYCEFNGRIYK